MPEKELDTGFRVFKLEREPPDKNIHLALDLAYIEGFTRGTRALVEWFEHNKPGLKSQRLYPNANQMMLMKCLADSAPQLVLMGDKVEVYHTRDSKGKVVKFWIKEKRPEPQEEVLHDKN